MSQDSETPPSEPETEPPKKERVLHTRIPAVLEAELKAAAAALRVPVSNLVRAILEDAVAIADRASEKVEDRLTRAAQTVHDERDRLKAKVSVDPLKDVLAHQSVTLAADCECARCGTELGAGTEASLAITSRPGPARFVCAGCVSQSRKNEEVP